MSGPIDITALIEGVPNFIREMDAAKVRVHDSLREEIERLTGKVEAGAEANVEGPVLNVETGALLHSINARIVEVGSLIVGKVGTPDIAGAFWEYGGRLAQGRLAIERNARGHLRWVRPQARRLRARKWLRPVLYDLKSEIMLLLPLVTEEAI